MPQIHEQTTLAEAAVAGSARSGRMTIQVITPGQGSSGSYSAAVCEAAAPLVAAGTPMYLDHPTEADDFQRPERSLRDLAAVFEGPGRWDPDRGAVVAQAKVFSPYREVLTEMAPYIGVSVRGDGEIDRRTGIVESITSIASVDFVTKAGRGGKVLDVIESARSHTDETLVAGALLEAKYDAEQLAALLKKGHAIRNDNGDPSYPIDDVADLRNAIRAVGRGGADHDRIRKYVAKRAKELDQADLIPDSWGSDGSMKESAALRESSANDTQQALSDAVTEAYGSGDTTYSWVRDYDPDTGLVYFDVRSPGQSATFQQTYSIGEDGTASLTGTRTEVNVRTTYVPVSPAGRPTTQESEEDTMPNIEESELAQLREAAGRVSTLESERDTIQAERDQARRELAESRATETARTRARSRVTEANGTLPAATVDRIVEAATRQVPLTEAGGLDETAFDTAVDAARTAEETYLAGLAEASGAGRVTGLGGFPVAEGDEEAKLREANDKQRAAMFGRKIKEA